MTKENNKTRRDVLKKAGGALLAIPVADSAAARDESNGSKPDNKAADDESREVVYADENVRIIKYSEHEYSIKGDYDPEERRTLMEEHVWSDNDEVSTQTHDDSTYENSAECVTVNGTNWHLYATTNAWAQADNGTLTFEGEASATSYIDCTYNYTQSVDEISISSTLGGTYNNYVSNISYAPSYSVSYEDAEATLEGSRTDESDYSIYHYKDAVVMDADSCWHDAYQDDIMTFSIDNEQHNLGNYATLDVGHCWS
jgi:hypothetical protein